MASFGTILGRLGELGTGYLAGTAEREEAARSERAKLISTGLQLGASGIDATQFLGPDTVSRDNRDWLGTRFANMGEQFTAPYRQAQERQVAATKADRDFNLFLENFRQTHATNRTTIGANATMAAAAIRRPDNAPDIRDELRLDEVTDTLIAREFGQIFPDAYGADGKIKPGYGAALAEFTDKVRTRVGTPESLAELRQRIPRVARELSPKLERTDNRLNPFSQETFKLGGSAQDAQAQLQAFVSSGNAAIQNVRSPVEREAKRRQVLSQIEQMMGPEARLAAEKSLIR